MIVRRQMPNMNCFYASQIERREIRSRTHLSVVLKSMGYRKKSIKEKS